MGDQLSDAMWESLNFSEERLDASRKRRNRDSVIVCSCVIAIVSLAVFMVWWIRDMENRFDTKKHYENKPPFAMGLPIVSGREIDWTCRFKVGQELDDTGNLQFYVYEHLGNNWWEKAGSSFCTVYKREGHDVPAIPVPRNSVPGYDPGCCDY